MTSRGTRIVAIAGLACAVALSAAIAVAAKPKVPSTITLRTALEGDEFVFRGRVRSEEPKCERNRKVKITAGHPFDPTPHKEGTVRTDEDGRYELRVPAATNTFGGYRAKALRKAKRRFVCKRAVSEISNPKPG
jgi:hypothetical protein